MGKHGILIIAMGLLALYAAAQTHISGSVTDSAGKAPLINVSLYIANTTIGTETNSKGLYEFSNLPVGNYQIIVSFIGYGTQVVEVNGTSGDHIINIVLNSKVTELKEVTIGPNSWQENLTRFKMEFIGTDNTQECKLLNDSILNLHFNNNRLTANTDDFLDIENRLLGYKLRFLVKDFWADYTTRQCHYLGSVIFGELHGTKKEEKAWAKNRLAVYNASFRHFLVSTSKNQTTNDQFIMAKMTRKPNPERPPDSIIALKYKQFAAKLRIHHTRSLDDSLLKWSKLSRQPKIVSDLSRQALYETDIIKPAGVPGIFQLQFTNYVYVIYKKKTVEKDFDDLFRFPQARAHQIAAVSLKNVNTPTFFNSRGILISQESLYYEGAWSSRIVNLLPDDYEPTQK